MKVGLGAECGNRPGVTKRIASLIRNPLSTPGRGSRSSQATTSPSRPIPNASKAVCSLIPHKGRP
ncbi:MAG: hypothetical protein HGB03_03185 [Candidatus Yonathbacteria bacterium]|nr:hypothetical protein [Candidatus Yonathbacteria bacterium]